MADEDKMQIDLAQIGDDNPRLQKLTPEMRLKLVQEKRCFHCRDFGHMASSDRCPLKTNKTGEQQQQPQERPKEWWKV
jgi:hypothetical protein